MVCLQQQGRIGTFPSTVGQEAACLGCAHALRDHDWIVPSFREVPALLWRGVPFHNFLMYYMGLEEGNLYPELSNVLPTAISVASQTVHAVGLAMAAQIRGDDAASLVFFGDGATSEGDFHEACNMAGVFHAPVILACINNQYAISMPREQQTNALTLAQKAIAYGFTGISVDGNDILACHVAAQEALERGRRGDGPTLIECVTYRVGPHTTAYDPHRYRDDAEVQLWEKRDPLRRFRAYLTERQLWSAEWQAEIEAEILTELDEALQTAEAALEAVDPLLMFEHVYHELPPDLQTQREQMAERCAQPVSFVPKRQVG
jgi:TPP-dependent pyruvate/acetoin dehydrogenase alpha subunit